MTETYRGTCHCGRIAFDVRAKLDYVVQCNCSVCRRMGALWHPAAGSDLRLVSGEAELALYQFGTKTAKHYFCRHCGIHPLTRPRLDPTRWVFNVRCIDGLNLASLKVVPFDGENWEAAAKAYYDHLRKPANQPQDRMPSPKSPVAIVSGEAPPKARQTNYPEPFASRMAGRLKRSLGDLFGLANLGVNLTRLAPGGVSALRHAHTKQDEFVYILRGHPTLHTDEGWTKLSPGMCAGFKAGTGNAHRLINETGEEVVYLEVGDRTPGDEVRYPDDDIDAKLVDGKWSFVHKDGSPYKQDGTRS